MQEQQQQIMIIYFTHETKQKTVMKRVLDVFIKIKFMIACGFIV